VGTIHAALFAGLPGINHPSELSFFLKLKEDILDQPIPLCDGYLSLGNLGQIRVDPVRLRQATDN
jgi:hypothetical protein